MRSKSVLLVHAALIALIAAAYFGLIAVGAPGLVAALVAGALFHPVRLRLQIAVNRLLRLEDDPYRLADRLSRRVQRASGPDEALASGAAAIRQGLNADGVVVEVHGAGTVAYGEMGADPLVVPLIWHGTPVGRLLVSGRNAAPPLVEMLARHLAEVAHAVRLTGELRRAHERLRATRDEERGRLLGVLDGGLGSTLAGLVTTVERADSDAKLQRVRQQLTEAVTDVRDLVYGLHPLTADEFDGPRRPAAAEEPGGGPRGSWRRTAVVATVWTGAVLSPLAVALATWLAWQTDFAGGLQPVDPIGLLFPAAGAFVITYRPRLPVPWLMWSVGVTWAGYELAFCGAQWMARFAPGHPLLPYVGWAAIWTWIWPVLTMSGIMPLLFPDGRLPSARWRPVLYGLVVLTAGHSVLMALTPDPRFEIYLPLENPFGVAALGRLPEIAEQNIGPAMVPLCVLAVASLGFRYRASGRDTRRQIAWYVATMMAFMAFWLVKLVLQRGTSDFDNMVLVAVQLLIAAGVPISVIAAVLRHRIYGIKVILNRTLVYSTLAAVLAFGYTALIWVGDTLAGDFGPVAGLVAALAVAAVFHPVRLRLQGSVDRLFGVERDPYRAADRLARTVQEAGDPAEALATATALVRWALRARGAGVEVDGELFVDGVLGDRPKAVELAWHGEPVGRLLLAGARQGREPLSVMAGHLAELAHAVRLAADLRRFRERIRATREAERRRLGRELHDGLGPALTGVTMTLDAARRTLPRDPESAAELLTQVRDGMSAALVSVRELVAGLRPPVLDDLGLAGALRAFAAGSPVTVHADDRLGELPPEVELAAYRIVLEAITNVRRHARADSAQVRLERANGELLVRVSDDGIGLPATAAAGVGLTSMRERAAEVGGSCAIGSPAGGGTEVSARLPL